MSAARTFAIGDIHGWLTALDTLLAQIAPSAEDTLVFLGDSGDYVDRGPDSKGVVSRLLELLADRTRPCDSQAGPFGRDQRPKGDWHARRDSNSPAPLRQNRWNDADLRAIAEWFR